jgi:hypothetical protein
MAKNTRKYTPLLRIACGGRGIIRGGEVVFNVLSGVEIKKFYLPPLMAVRVAPFSRQPNVVEPEKTLPGS